MASGVRVQDNCKEVFSKDLKMGKNLSYIIYKLTDDLKEIEIQETGDKCKTYEDLMAILKAAEEKQECRYAVYDCKGCTKDNKEFQKILFIAWSPDTAKIKQKMVYASSKDALKKALGEGIHMEVQANDQGDMDFGEITDRIAKSMRK